MQGRAGSSSDNDGMVQHHQMDQDWHRGSDVEKKIISSIEIEVFYVLEEDHGVKFIDEEMNELTENFMLIAKRLDYR